MLCVELEVKPSKIHGYGLFTKKPIKKGDLIWCASDGFGKIINQNYYYSLNNVQKKNVDIYFPQIDGGIHVFGDYSIFMNHSNNPNVGHLSEEKVIAIKDIEEGEELLGNYDELH